MAEKEEFLFVLRVEENDELRNIIPYCNGCTFWPCDKECISRKKPITRQEAINRMAKAVYDKEIVACNEALCAGKECKDCFRWEKCEDIAEAALDALLSRI